MQQNLNPKGKKKSQQGYAGNQRNGLAPRPAASGRRRLPALFLACRGLHTLAHCTSPVKKTFSAGRGTDLTVLAPRNGLHQLSGEKTTYASDRKLADGREWLELLSFIVLFVMHRFRRVYLLNLRKSTFCYQGAAQYFSVKSLFLKVGQDKATD